MNGMPATLSYLLITWGTITAVLLALVIYGNTLSIREDDEIYLNRTEDHMMAAEQRVLITKNGPAQASHHGSCVSFGDIAHRQRWPLGMDWFSQLERRPR